MKNKNTQKGFTLIELMIVVAILGILSAIALPSYSRYIEKSRRTDAKVELLRVAQLQESYFAQNLSYANSIAQLKLSPSTDPKAPAGSVLSQDGYYNIWVFSATGAAANCSPGTANTCTSYVLRAAPVATQAQVGDTVCTGFGIDNVTRKFAIGTTGVVKSTTWNVKSKDEIKKINECWGK